MRNRISKSMLAVILIIAMAAAVGCSSSGGGEKKSGGGSEKSKQEEKKGLDIKATIEEQVLIEKDGVKITATGLDSDGENGFLMDLSVKNDTDKVYSMWADDIVVNGYQMLGGMDYIKPGESEMEFNIRGYGVFGYVEIGEIGEIELDNIKVMEMVEMELEEDQEGDPYYETAPGQFENPFFQGEQVIIQTSAYGEMKEAVLPEGEEVYNENGIQIVKVAAHEEDKKNGTCEMFFLKNDSNDEISIGSKDSSINDFMLDAMLGYGIMSTSAVAPGQIGVFNSGMDAVLLQYAMDTEEEVSIESMECTIVVNKTAYDEEYGYSYDEPIAEIPYSYAAE